MSLIICNVHSFASNLLPWMIIEGLINSTNSDHIDDDQKELHVMKLFCDIYAIMLLTHLIDDNFYVLSTVFTWLLSKIKK